MEKFQNKYRIPSARLKNWDYGWNGAYFLTVCTASRKHFFGEIINGEMHLNDAGLMANNFWGEIPEHFPYTLLGEYIIMPDHMHGILMIDKLGGTDNRGPNGIPTDTSKDADNGGPNGIGIDTGKDAINRVSAVSESVSDPVSESVSDPVSESVSATGTENIGGITGNKDAINRVSAVSESVSVPVPVSESTSATGTEKIGGITGNRDAINRVSAGGITGNHNPMIQENISRIIRWYKGRTTFEIHKSLPTFGWQSRFHDIIIRDDTAYHSISKYICNNPRNWKDDKSDNHF